MQKKTVILRIKVEDSVENGHDFIRFYSLQ